MDANVEVELFFNRKSRCVHKMIGGRTLEQCNKDDMEDWFALPLNEENEKLLVTMVGEQGWTRCEHESWE